MATTLLPGIRYRKQSYALGPDGVVGPKVCTTCGESAVSFGKDRTHKDGLRSECKECRVTSRRALREPRGEPGPKTCTRCGESGVLFDKDRSHIDGLRSICVKCMVIIKQLEHKNDPRKRMLFHARCRAKERGLDFSIEIDDIKIPEFCPVLGIKLTPAQTGECNLPTLPSLDRIDNSKGYTPDNIYVISHRANKLKSDATIEETEAILRYMKGELR